MQFTSTVELEEEGPFSTFSAAAENFFPRMRRLLEEGCALMVLEATCWIAVDNYGAKTPLMFYDARDIAYELGILLGDGELANPLPEVTNDQFEEAWL